MMRKLLLTGLLLVCVLAAAGADASAEQPVVRVFRFSEVIQPASAEAFSRAIDDAETAGASLLIAEVDTPGGMVTSTKDIVGAILGSKVPVCLFVTPAGAQAASGGFFLLLAADIAVMSPVTTTGAAHPVNATGENKEDDVMLKKIAEDLSALVRSAASARGRPQEVAEQAVRDAKAWNAEEALEVGLIDFLAQDRSTLIAELDGREITRADGSKITLVLTDALVEEHEYSTLEVFKNFLLNPFILLALLAAGTTGLYMEFQHPGLILPGVVGVVCLLFFAWGSQLMPVNYFGVGLLALGIVMFVLEIKIISHGMLSLGGTICLGVGMWILFPRDVPGLGISAFAILPLLLFMVTLVGGVTYFVAKAHRQPVTTGREGMPGKVGHVAKTIDGVGTVFVNGEYWNARAAEPIEAGSRIQVLSVDGFVLEVGPERSAAVGGPPPSSERGES